MNIRAFVVFYWWDSQRIRWWYGYKGIKVKVKVTLVQALRLCTGRRAHRARRGIALPFRDHGTRRGWGFRVTPRPFLSPGKTRYPLYRRLGGPQDRSGQVRKISPPTGIRSPDRPARSQSLYQLSYPAHNTKAWCYPNLSTLFSWLCVLCGEKLINASVALRPNHQQKTLSVALVRERTIPTERPPPVGEVSAKFCW